MCDLCGLPPAPAEAKKMWGFCAAQDFDDQAFSTYCYPMGDTCDILKDIDNHISSPSSGMRSKKVS